MNLKQLVFLAVGAALVMAPSCSRTAGGSDSWQNLLAESDRLAAMKEWEPATECVLKALSAEDLTAGGESLSLSRLAALDIMTWRDAQGWKHALEAERLARSEGTDSLIAIALLQKGRLQLVGAITEGEAQDADALATFEEALPLAAGSPDIQADILLQMSQAYIGLNRFNDIIDPELYAKAGDCIDRAVATAKEPAFPSKALPYWMRWYRQGGNWEDGIECCEKVLEGLDKDDFLMQSQCWNNLVMLYAQAGDVQNAATAHQQYVYAMEYYMQKKADARLQEMETRYETSIKEGKIARMHFWVVLLLVLIAALVFFAVLSQVYTRRIIASDRGKEQLLKFISKDFTSPTSGHAFPDMSDESAIRARCEELLGKEDSKTAEEVASYMISLSKKRSKEISKLGLTARELEVIRLSAEGLSAGKIAERLYVSMYTIKNHKQNIYLKMGVRSNAEMIKRANEVGIV